MIFGRLVSVLFLLTAALHAGSADRVKIDVGGMFATSFETDMQLSKKGFPIGGKINTKDQLGMDSDTASFRIGGHYRFSDSHGTECSYYGVRSDSHKTVDRELEWNGDLIEARAMVDSYLDMDVFKINYAYSFYHSDRVELALGAGLHITSIRLGLTAQGKINGVEKQNTSESSSVTAPLPIVGFGGEYAIIPERLFARYQANYFYLAPSDYKGALISNTMALEYGLMGHVRAGFGFDSDVIVVEMDDGEKKVEVETGFPVSCSIFRSYTDKMI
ncbi:MAG: hypothetical protein B5M52_02395 [Helicobacteraceae bacterium 4484_230]|nr:MAG: hypothetical protein B5M52_02395 [Helicobacteraceae bacterium 4484_230]